MAHLIDRDALVAEIENLENTYKECPTRNSYEEGLKDGRLIGYKDALHKINTLEVKEVDLQEEPASEDMEKELDNWRHIHFSGRRDGKLSGEYLERSSQLDLARHFVNWQKQQMMKDAVDGEIAILKTRLGQMLIAKSEILNDDKFKWGDKVKLIIIKED